MWNLSGDDIQRAKEELVGRRAAIQAAYDNGMKQVEKELADLEAFERTAVNMLSHLKGGDAVAKPVAEPAPAAVSEPEAAPSPEPAAEHVEAEPEAEAPPEGGRGSSRWRMRLGTADGTR